LLKSFLAMRIMLNNIPEEFDREIMTVNDLLREKNFTFKLLVTRVNDVLVKKEERDTTYIHDGDNVIVLHLISGG
jgi:thiamine biosynthesis protein ThiS